MQNAVEIIGAVAVCVWLLFPVVLALLLEYPLRRREKEPRRACGVRFVNH